MKPAVRSLLLGQIILFGGLLACIILKPAGLATNDGISYYGIFRVTFFPYAVGLLGAAYFAVHAIADLPGSEMRLIRYALRLYAALVIGIVITPYSAGNFMDYLHTVCGSSLFSLQLVLCGWLIGRLHGAWWSIVLSSLCLLAGIMSAAYLNPSHGFLMQSQALFQLAFGSLLLLSLQRLAPSAPTAR